MTVLAWAAPFLTLAGCTAYALSVLGGHGSLAARTALRVLTAVHRTRTEPRVKVLAVVLWVLAWAWSGLIPAAFFAARNGDAAMARAELASGVLGATALAVAGALLW